MKRSEARTVSVESMETAAQVWCRPETSHIVMDCTLAQAFAEVLDEVKARASQWQPEDDQPCPDPRCNDRLGSMPMPQCVAAVAWAEESDALRQIAEAARDFIWEPENWEAYQDSKDSNSVAWPPEFLLMAQAVEKKYGAMPVDDDQPLPSPPTGEVVGQE
jgi:hypothetical protein